MVRQEAARIPAFDLGRIRQWRKKITVGLTSFYNTILANGQFDALLDALYSALKLDDGRADQKFALRQSMLEFHGHELTGRLGDQLSTKLAGGLSLLKKGKPITGTLGKPGWYPVVITDMRFGRVVHNKTRVNMTTMITAGSMSGREILKSVTYKMVIWMLANELAWSMTDMRPLHTELVGMWFMAYVVQKDNGSLDIDEVKCLAQHKRYNKKLRKQRAKPCVRHYNQRCHTCPVGYSECMLGTHRYTWILKPCKACKREYAAFDPEQKNAKACISCQTKNVRAHWARERMN